MIDLSINMNTNITVKLPSWRLVLRVVTDTVLGKSIAA